MYVTARAIGRLYRFVPQPAVRELLRYVLAVAANKYGVLIHEYQFLSNHFHLQVTVPGKCLPDFMMTMNSLISRGLNALRGTRGTNIEKGYSLVVELDDATVLEHSVYTLANCVEANIVQRTRHYQGVSSHDLRYGQSITIKRPKRGLWAPKSGRRRNEDARWSDKRDRSILPEEVTLTLVRPSIYPALSDDELRDLVLSKLKDTEGRCEVRRRRTGKRVLGMRRAKAMHYNTEPGKEELFHRRPTVAARNSGRRVAELARRAVFLKEYRVAKERWLAGERNVEFPEGTWWMWRRYSVRCVVPP